MFTGSCERTAFVVTETDTGNQLILNDFQEGDFGIRFYDELIPPEDPVAGNEIKGDLKAVDFDPTQTRIQSHLDQWMNVITDSAQPDRPLRNQLGAYMKISVRVSALYFVGFVSNSHSLVISARLSFFVVPSRYDCFVRRILAGALA